MITFDEKNRIIHLTNKSISYYIYINKQGYLETLYFGKYLAQLDDCEDIREQNVTNDSTQYFDVEKNEEFTYEDNFDSKYARLEYSPYGKMDKRGSPIVIKKENGSYDTNFLYHSHKIYSGLKKLDRMPCVYNGNLETLEITLKEDTESIYLKYFLSIYDDCDILVKNFVIENKSGKDIRILKAMSLQQDLFHCNYRVVHFRGRWAKERDYIINDVYDGVQEVSSNYGRSSHEENPFVYLMDKNANNDYGEVIGFNLVYSGNFKFRIFSDYQQYIRILYGINDEDFEWILEDGNEFITPQAVISYSYQGVDKMSQNFHYFIKKYLIQYKNDSLYKPVLFNSWEGCCMNFNTNSILSYIDDAKKIGSELFVLDDGWFSHRNNDDTGLGDWFVNEEKIDLHRVIDYCHKNNMKFGIWFEPEMVNPDSSLCKNRFDWLLGEKELKHLTIHRHQFCLDFSNPNVVDNIYNQMIKVIDKYEIDYIKWDHNRYIAEHFSKYYNSLHQGEIYHRITIGYYNLLSRLTEKYPHIMFEGCASGGGRFDLGTLFYCPQIWASDESDPIQRIFIQYNTSLGYPLSTIGSHINDSVMTSYSTKAKIALFGTYGCEMNPNKLTLSEIDEINDISDIYKKYHSEVIADGVLYHLLSPNITNYICLECVSRSKDRAIILFMNKLKELPLSRFIRLKGLDENKYYRNNYNNKVYLGSYYMQVGLNFSFETLKEFSCKLIILEDVTI